MITFWLITVTLIVCEAKHLRNIEDSILYEIQEFTSSVSSTYFSEARCISFITAEPGVELLYKELPVFYIHYDDNDSELDFLVLTALDAGCLAFILQVKDIKWMMERFSQLFRSPRSQYRANRRYLYLPTGTNNMDDDFLTSKSLNWMPDLLYVKLATEKNVSDKLNYLKQNVHGVKELEDTYEKIQTVQQHEIFFFLEIYTHRFVGEKSSEKSHLDTWLPGFGFMTGAELYPNKLHDLMGKEIALISFPYPPVTLMILDTTPQVLDGFEFQIIYEFAKKRNFTWRMVYDLENWWGTIWENESGNGIVGAVVDDRADLAFGAIYQWDREFLFTDYSACYYRSGLTAMPPKPKYIPGWQIPLQPFGSYMWYAVLASVILIPVTLYSVSHASHKLLGGKIASRYITLLECCFRTAGLLVQQVPDEERNYATVRYVPLRHLVTWIIFFFLVVSSAYGGALSSTLTLPQFEPPIDTPKELAESGLHWAAVHEAYLYGFRDTSDPVMETITRNFVVYTEDELTERAYDESLALLVERLQGGYFVQVKYVFKEMVDNRRLMKEDIDFNHFVFMLRKGSPFKEPLNYILYQLREAGIITYWEGATVRNFLSSTWQLSVSHSRAPPEAVLTKLAVTHIQGALYLLTFGLLLALVTFVLELVTETMGKERSLENIFLFY